MEQKTKDKIVWECQEVILIWFCVIGMMSFVEVTLEVFFLDIVGVATFDFPGFGDMTKFLVVYTIFIPIVMVIIIILTVMYVREMNKIGGNQDNV